MVKQGTYGGDFEPRLWEAATGRPVANLRGHEESVTDIQFTADGQWLLTASEDRTARIWEAGTGRLVGTLKGHRLRVTHAEHRPGSREVLTVSKDGTARLWRVPKLDAPAERLPLLIQVWTGTDLGPAGDSMSLSLEDWRALRATLDRPPPRAPIVWVCLAAWAVYWLCLVPWPQLCEALTRGGWAIALAAAGTAAVVWGTISSPVFPGLGMAGVAEKGILLALFAVVAAACGKAQSALVRRLGAEGAGSLIAAFESWWGHTGRRLLSRVHQRRRRIGERGRIRDALPFASPLPFAPPPFPRPSTRL
jgi:hypothetical protein